MTNEKPAAWKVVIAAILDFFLIFLGGGYVIALLTGGITDGGFSLNGLPAIGLFALVIVYFVGMKRIGGTVFKRVFGIAS